jgi:sugar phosphate isomerase/epimerase
VKLGIITDGISREFEHALDVMKEFGLEYAELQFLWDKEIGDLDDRELARAQSLVAQREVKVCCITRHIFAGLLVGETRLGDATHSAQMEALQRCIDTAKAFDCGLVRIMSFRKEMILFGSGGAEQWNVSTGAWEKLLQLLAPAVQLAEDQGVTLVVETGNNAMITSAYLARKLIDALGSKHLKVLWDPGNSLYCNEPAYPDGYEALGLLTGSPGGYLGHLHVKDCRVDIPKASVEQCQFGHAQMAPYFEDIASGLKRDGYQGVVSLESVYRPGGGTFEDGFRASFGEFQRIFGD